MELKDFAAHIEKNEALIRSTYFLESPDAFKSFRHILADRMSHRNGSLIDCRLYVGRSPECGPRNGREVPILEMALLVPDAIGQMKTDGTLSYYLYHNGKVHMHCSEVGCIDMPPVNT